MSQQLVAGVDTSTQSCKVVVRDAATGALVREGRAAHPDGTEVHPSAWEDALRAAVDAAGGLDDVAAVAVGGQQHGMVCLDASGEVVRPALLWNDTRSAQAARDLVDDLGSGTGRERQASGARAWASAVGLVPVASFTASKLRWLADAEPEDADRTAAVCLPHDWLTWRLAGGFDAVGLEGLVTDRGDASGTGYFSAATGEYRRDLLQLALRGRSPQVPRVLGPSERAGFLSTGWGGGGGAGTLLAPGTGDNAAAALGLAARDGDVVLSLGTSGVVGAVTETAVHDASGTVAGFADATGRHLPLVVTLNAAQVLDATASLLGVDHAELARLALSAPAGAEGLVMVPYLQGERTPNRPYATGALHGLKLRTMTPAHLARAAVEGLLCGLADGIAALEAHGVQVRRVLLVGGGARSAAVQQLAPSVLGRPVVVPTPGEYVADGAARQAAWVLSGEQGPPEWSLAPADVFEADDAASAAGAKVRRRYAEVRDLTDGL